MSKVYSIHQSGIPQDAVNIMRPSKWGNPFKIGVDGNRAQVLEKFREYLFQHPKLVEEARSELCGKDLICCCSPKPCHGDIWLEVLNTEQLC